MQKTTRLVLGACLGLGLAACTRTARPLLSASTPDAGLPPTPRVAVNLEPSPEPSPAATPVPYRLGLVLPEARPAPESIEAMVLAELKALSKAGGWTLSVGDEGSAEAMIREGADLMVWTGEGNSVRAYDLARDHPEIEFLMEGLNAPPRRSANVTLLGGPDSRLDELAFLAGALAGWVTETRVVGMAGNTSTVDGLKYGNGFVHGVRFSCGGCAIHTLDLPPDVSAEDLRDWVAGWMDREVDVAFATPARAGAALLAELAGQGVWVIGAGRDMPAGALGNGVAAGAERLLGSVVFRPDVLMRELVPGLAGGSRPSTSIPYALGSGSISLSALNPERVSPAVQARLAETIALLSSGALDTGIDPATGLAR